MKYLGLLVELFKIKRRNWKAVLLSVVAATVFWFFNALNKEYTANIDFPVDFAYDQQAFMPASALPEKIRISVTGLGWNLFRKSVGVKVPPLSIPLDEPAVTRRRVGTALQPVFAEQLTGLKVNYVLEDTLLLHLDNRKTRTVFLSMDGVQTALREGYGLAGPVTLTPDSVVPTGPQVLLDALTDTIQLTIPARRLGSDYREDLAVPVDSGEFIVRDPPVIAVSIPVARTERRSLRLPVELINRKPGIRYDATDTLHVPVNITTWCDGEIARFNRAKVTVDVSGLTRGTGKVLPSFSGLPSCVIRVGTDSVTVTVQ